MNVLDNIIQYTQQIDILELLGLLFGLVCVILLIYEHILTWLFGILYVLVSFVVFWQAALYGDFILHIIFLILNIYGWYSWANPGKKSEILPITSLAPRHAIAVLAASLVGILIFAEWLKALPRIWEGLAPAALPYWDSTTSVLSVTGIILSTRKKIDNWYYWIVVDIIATGVYFYKGLYFYFALYGIYIGLAYLGYRQWRRSRQEGRATAS